MYLDNMTMLNMITRDGAYESPAVELLVVECDTVVCASRGTVGTGDDFVWV